LFAGLDSFGHHVQIEGARRFDDGADDLKRLRAFRDPADE